MCVNGLLIIICELILIKVKLTALFSVEKNDVGAYDNNKIRQYLIVAYLVWCLDAKLSGKFGKSMQSYSSCWTNEFLYSKLRKLLCNSVIQPYFDYTCISWYLLVIQKIRQKYR